jgi:hypothetical protein
MRHQFKNKILVYLCIPLLLISCRTMTDEWKFSHIANSSTGFDLLYINKNGNFRYEGYIDISGHSAGSGTWHLKGDTIFFQSKDTIPYAFEMKESKIDSLKKPCVSIKDNKGEEYFFSYCIIKIFYLK